MFLFTFVSILILFLFAFPVSCLFSVAFETGTQGVG